jgi:hypothetical protein
VTDEARPQIEVTISAPVDEVWDALRSRDKIRHWMGWEYDGLDSEIDLIFFTDTVEDASARTLTLHGGDELGLEPDGAGTRVTLTRAAHGDNPDWDAYYDDITEGWVTFLQQLRFAVERHPGAARRTLAYVGGNDNSLHLLDVLDLADLAAGDSFHQDLLGQDVTGEAWFRSDLQLGITVDTWGDGLLVLSSAEPSPRKPNGAAMAILTTYGLDDSQLADLDARWRSWWAEHFPGGE